MSSEMISSPFIRLAGVSDTLHAPKWCFTAGADPPSLSRENPLTLRSDSECTETVARSSPSVSWLVVQSKHYAVRVGVVQFGDSSKTKTLMNCLQKGRQATVFVELTGWVAAQTQICFGASA